MKYLPHTLLLLFVLLSSINQAQKLKPVNYQFSFGSNYTIPYENKTSLDDWRYDYNGGLGYFTEVLVQYNINHQFVIRSGLNYNYTSYKGWYLLEYASGNYIAKTSDLHIPISLIYQPFKSIPINIAVGPYIGISLTARQEGTVYLDRSEFIMENPNDPAFQEVMNFDMDAKDSYTNMDWGVDVELNYEFSLSDTITAVVLTRFKYGLLNTVKDETADIKWKNYSVNLGFGIKI